MLSSNREHWIGNETNQEQATYRKQRTTRKTIKTATQTPALMKSMEYCSVTASSACSSTVVTKHKQRSRMKVKQMSNLE